MGRYVAEYTIGQPDDFIRLVSEDYFQKEGFKLVPYKGEMLWKKGRGVLTAPQYIKLAYGQGIVHVEAFIRWTILPGVYVGEMALDNGFVGAIPKSMLMDKVNTLLRLLSGRYRPWHGSVRYENRDAAKVYLPQNPRLSFLKDTLAEDVAFLLEQAGLPSGRADELMRRFPFFARLGPLMRSNPLDLSGGQQQMAALFKAMLAEPDVLLLDEPTKGLDARLKNELAALLGTLKSAGVCMIMASHDVEFAAAVADRCAMLFSGVIVQDDAPYDFFVSNRFYTTGLCKITNGILEQPAVRFSDLAANREAYV